MPHEDNTTDRKGGFNTVVDPSERPNKQLTRREQTAHILRTRPETPPSSIQAALSDNDINVSLDTIIEDIHSIKQSLKGTDEQIYAIPPRCKKCGFDNWDNIAQIPSACGDNQCHSEWISEPKFTIR